MLKLNIGCGLKYKKGYINIDAYDDTVADVIMNTCNLNYDDDSIDLIESFQLVENLGYMNTILAIGEWFRVLKTHSSIVIECHDVDKAFELYLNTNDHTQKALILNWIFGIIPEHNEHKFCFPSGLLRKLFIEAGFVDIMEKYHDKVFGVPSYTFIAKKPLDPNPNYLLIHKLRKRCFEELNLFKSKNILNYQLDFEKSVLGHVIDFTPRDFSTITFNELFINCAIYSLKSTAILVEESCRLNIISLEQAQMLLDQIHILEEHSFPTFLYHTWEENFFKYSNPEKAYSITIDIAKNLTKQALFDLRTEDFKTHIKQSIQSTDLHPLINETYFSNYYIENTLSKFLGKYIKGTCNEAEKKICDVLTAMLHPK